MRRLVLLAAACALLPAPATAATRYVSTDGAASGRCARSAPCSVAYAINGAGSNRSDTVVVLSGTYSDQLLTLSKPLTVTGPEVGARPVFRATQDGGAALTVAAK